MRHVSVDMIKSGRLMPRYIFSAYSAESTLVTGEISADSRPLALDQIARRGLTPVQISEGANSIPWWNRDISIFGGAGELSHRELEMFFTTFAAMLRAGFSLPRAIAFCEARTSAARTRRALGTVRAELENGANLRDAMNSAGSAFSSRLQSLISTGEAANRLQETASRISVMLSSEVRMRRDLSAALIYPAILLVMSALVIGVVVFYLAPTILPVFATAGAESPKMLLFLSGFGEMLKNNWLLLATISAIFLVVAYASRAALHAAVSRVLLSLPITGGFLRKQESLRMCQSLLMMLGSGATLIRAIAAAREEVALAPFRDLLQHAHDLVSAGSTLSQTLSNESLIDRTAVALIAAGEESDRLVEVLGIAVDALAMETAAAQAQAIRLLTPILTLLIGLSVGGIILTTISAIMDMNDIAF
jgi:type II secretory pathway component PulF